MIGYLHGTARAHDILDVGGVGYQIACPTPLTVGEDHQLWVHTSVREDAIDLYGFTDTHERDLFRALVRVSGVGPRLALAVISALTWPVAARALHERDTATLATVPGIGPKKAASIATAITIPTHLLAAAPAGADDEPGDVEILDALEAMGYRRQAITTALRDARDATGSTDTTILTRAVMRALAA